MMLTNCPYDSNLGDCTLIQPAAGVTCHMCKFPFLEDHIMLVISKEAVLFQVPSYFPSIHEPFEKPTSAISSNFSPQSFFVALMKGLPD